MFHNIGSRATRKRVTASTNLFQAASAGVQALIAQGTGGQTANIQEWRNSSGTALAAVASDGTVLTGNGTASTPGIHGTTTNSGIYWSVASPAISVSGILSCYWDAASFILYQAGIALTWSANGDVKLYRDAAGVLAQRVGTAAQKHSIYNTFTDASNYERGIFDWQGSTNVLSIGTEKAGTGSTRNMRFIVGGSSVMDYGITNAGRWSFASTGILSCIDIWIGAALNTQLVSTTNAVLLLRDNSGTTFNRIQFGGTTSSFSSLKSSTTSLEAKLADDSAYTNMRSIETMTDFHSRFGAL